MNATKQKHTFIYAMDPYLKRRVVYVVKDGWAISLISGHKFKYGGK